MGRICWMTGVSLLRWSTIHALWIQWNTLKACNTLMCTPNDGCDFSTRQHIHKNTYTQYTYTMLAFSRRKCARYSYLICQVEHHLQASLPQILSGAVSSHEIISALALLHLAPIITNNKICAYLAPIMTFSVQHNTWWRRRWNRADLSTQFFGEKKATLWTHLWEIWGFFWESCFPEGLLWVGGSLWETAGVSSFSVLLVVYVQRPLNLPTNVIDKKTLISSDVPERLETVERTEPTMPHTQASISFSFSLKDSFNYLFASLNSTLNFSSQHVVNRKRPND